jgi:hypothetical protein
MVGLTQTKPKAKVTLLLCPLVMCTPPKHGRVSCGSNDASKAASHKEFNLLVEKYVGVGAAIDEN